MKSDDLPAGSTGGAPLSLVSNREIVPSNPREEQVARIIQKAKLCGFTLSTAESLTGGGIFNTLISLPGAGSVMDQGTIVYSDQAKTQLLGVPHGDISTYSAVSGEVAKGMAKGILDRSNTNLAVSATGFAGPSGLPEDQETKPAGTLYIGIAFQPEVPDGALHEEADIRAYKYQLSGTNRAQDIEAAIGHALDALESTIDKHIKKRRIEVPEKLMGHSQMRHVS
jgi:nicotinamide-nucleotide amidase